MISLNSIFPMIWVRHFSPYAIISKAKYNAFPSFCLRDPSSISDSKLQQLRGAVRWVIQSTCCWFDSKSCHIVLLICSATFIYFILRLHYKYHLVTIHMYAAHTCFPSSHVSLAAQHKWVSLSAANVNSRYFAGSPRGLVACIPILPSSLPWVSSPNLITCFICTSLYFNQGRLWSPAQADCSWALTWFSMLSCCHQMMCDKKRPNLQWPTCRWSFWRRGLCINGTSPEQRGCIPVGLVLLTFYAPTVDFIWIALRLNHFWPSISVWSEWRHCRHPALLFAPLTTMGSARAVWSLDSCQKLHTVTTLQIRSGVVPRDPAEWAWHRRTDTQRGRLSSQQEIGP